MAAFVRFRLPSTLSGSPLQRWRRMATLAPAVGRRACPGSPDAPCAVAVAGPILRGQGGRDAFLDHQMAQVSPLNRFG